MNKILAILFALCNYNHGKNSTETEISNNNMESINIAFDEVKPEYFGFTGIHLYAVKTKVSNNQKMIGVDKDANAITLYKLYWDLAIFLSDSLSPSDKNTTVETYAIFGNSQHKERLICKEEISGLKIVGYLNSEDVDMLFKFLNDNSLYDIDSVKNHFKGLKPEIKEELTMLLGDDLFPSIQSYLKLINKFITECKKDNREVLLIYNA